MYKESVFHPKCKISRSDCENEIWPEEERKTTQHPKVRDNDPVPNNMWQVLAIHSGDLQLSFCPGITLSPPNLESDSLDADCLGPKYNEAGRFCRHERVPFLLHTHYSKKAPPTSCLICLSALVITGLGGAKVLKRISLL